ncbi:MAG: DUF4258 domain-containing protein [Phycisphaeraceae bacterium]|nr:DUF4258 domain-containing protein [Phycisphaeraceae bacterium]
MSSTLEHIQSLVAAGKWMVSVHADERLEERDIDLEAIIQGVSIAVDIEEYPDASSGPCVLVLQHDPHGEPIHVVWGIRQGTTEPAVIVTVYQPDPDKWSPDFLKRRS